MFYSVQYIPVKTTVNRRSLIISEISFLTGTGGHKESIKCALILHDVTLTREVY